MRFYLGVPEATWPARGLFEGVPTCLSHGRLRTRGRRSRYPRARGPWVLDSGAYSVLRRPPHRWVETPEEYATAVRRYEDEIGPPEWVAPQDWLCGPEAVSWTGLSVPEHQRRTVESVLVLQDLGLPVIPVLQGSTTGDYLAHVRSYQDQGVDLSGTVGVGSIADRPWPAVAGILGVLAALDLELHAFGAAKRVLLRCSHLLSSADSMAWSSGGRINPPEPGCRHRQCQNCPVRALRWHREVLDVIDRPEQSWFLLEGGLP